MFGISFYYTYYKEQNIHVYHFYIILHEIIDSIVFKCIKNSFNTHC